MSLAFKSGWKLFIKRRAAEDLNSLPKSVQKRIIQKMRFFISQDDPVKFAKKLKRPKRGQYRFRIGDHRVIFDVGQGKEIIILKIAKRDEIYR